MPLLYRTVVALDWLIALAWLGRVLLWERMIARIPDLTRTSFEHPSQRLPRLSVIVPARNEAAGIAATLRSLLGSAGVELEIVAVDDRSVDETGLLMETVKAELASQSPMLQVLHVTELPPGWLGKTHAMALAARNATGEWLLFTDGDVLFDRDALRQSLAFATSTAADHVVLLPTILLRSFGERMMIPFLQTMSIWALRPWRVEDPKARRDAIGVGAFNLIRREAYDAIGGWESMPMEVLEDVALGRRVKERGLRQRMILGCDLVSVRWAHGALGVVRNLTKNLFALFDFRAELLLGFCFLLGVFTLLPLATSFCWARPRWAACVMFLALALAYRQAGKYHHFSAAQVLLFPVAAVLMLYTLLYSMILVQAKGGVSWRGTFYSLRELRKQPPRRG